ncbi:MAG TPA: hypothetical protein VGF34_05390 [Stellaceae bacterium]|jgi:hypothetical protein
MTVPRPDYDRRSGRDPKTVPATAAGVVWPGLCRALVFLGIGAALLALLFECRGYLLSGLYLDHIEGNVVIAGWQYLQGGALYGLDAGIPRLATYYGPLAYLAPLPPLLLLGPSVAASKLTSVLALAATIAAMGFHFFRQRPREAAAPAFLILVAGLLLFSPVSFWVRSDPLETLLVALAVAAASSRKRGWRVGACIGLAVNLKLHAFAYFLPLLVDLCCRDGRRALLVAASLAGLTFILPFFAPGIDFGDYIQSLAAQVGGRTPSPGLLAAVVPLLLLLLIPIAVPLAAWEQPREARIYGLAALATAALLLYPATFPGAGPYHFLPLVPVLADVRSRLRSAGPADLLPVAIVVLGCVTAHRVLHDLAVNRNAAAVSAAALRLVRDSPVRPVEIGYGDSLPSYEAAQLSRTVLVLNAYPVSFDAQVLMELKEIGIDGSARWVPELTRCRVRRWLVPKGEAPFALRSFFYDGRMLFDDKFRRAFLANYKRVDSTGPFDVWDCAHPS